MHSPHLGLYLLSVVPWAVWSRPLPAQDGIPTETPGPGPPGEFSWSDFLSSELLHEKAPGDISGLSAATTTNYEAQGDAYIPTYPYPFYYPSHPPAPMTVPPEHPVVSGLTLGDITPMHSMNPIANTPDPATVNMPSPLTSELTVNMPKPATKGGLNHQRTTPRTARRSHPYNPTQPRTDDAQTTGGGSQPVPKGGVFTIGEKHRGTKTLSKGERIVISQEEFNRLVAEVKKIRGTQRQQYSATHIPGKKGLVTCAECPGSGVVYKHNGRDWAHHRDWHTGIAFKCGMCRGSVDGQVEFGTRDFINHLKWRHLAGYREEMALNLKQNRQNRKGKGTNRTGST